MKKEKATTATGNLKPIKRPSFHYYISKGFPKTIANTLVENNLMLGRNIRTSLLAMMQYESVIAAFLQHPGDLGAGSGRRAWLEKFAPNGTRFHEKLDITISPKEEVELSDLIKLLFRNDPRFAEIPEPPKVVKVTAMSMAFAKAK